MKKKADILQYSDVLASVPLFAGIAPRDLTEMLSCLEARLMTYETGNFIYLAGDEIASLGVVCEGTVLVIREDAFGNRSIQAKLESGDIFAETFVCAQVDHIPVSVVTDSKCVILFADYRRIVTTCSATCVFHSKLIENMLGTLARKNLMLNRKLEVLTSRTTRGKLLAYLSEQSKTADSRVFEIPFDRQELADYLSVDRSAMSAELGRMRGEGLIDFQKNRFEILGGE